MNSINLGLSLRQEQKLNTQLLQTMDTIALSTEELKEKIKKEEEKNPTLIVKDRTESFDALSSSGSSKDDDEKANWIERAMSEKESLSEHLLKQLGCIDLDEKTRSVAETIISSLDQNGFTGENPENLVSEKDRPYFAKALSVVQSLDPSGVGAKDWKDSLLLQIKEEGADDDELNLFKHLIYKELDNIKSGKIETIAKELKTDKEDVEAMLDLIKSLTPFPGLAYSSEYDGYIIPELSIKKKDGKLVLLLNRFALPIVEVDPSYIEMEKELKGEKTEENKIALKYLKENISNANSLISQIAARESTLERTGTVLMEKQKDFFLYGPLYLKGLTMKEVADEVGVHEATISRVASSKYIDTDFGIFPIRYLFSAKPQKESGNDLSKNAIKETIRKIIEENKDTKALSDQKICNILSERGITIARRTVSKYRKELNIDSSFDR